MTFVPYAPPPRYNQGEFVTIRHRPAAGTTPSRIVVGLSNAVRQKLAWPIGSRIAMAIGEGADYGRLQLTRVDGAAGISFALSATSGRANRGGCVQLPVPGCVIGDSHPAVRIDAWALDDDAIIITLPADMVRPESVTEPVPADRAETIHEADVAAPPEETDSRDGGACLERTQPDRLLEELRRRALAGIEVASNAELAAAAGIPLRGLSRAICALEDGGAIRVRREGSTTLCRRSFWVADVDRATPMPAPADDGVVGITDIRAGRALAVLEAAVRDGQACPSNPELATQIGLARDSKGAALASVALYALQARHAIQIDHGPRQTRRVYVASLDAWTAPDPRLIETAPPGASGVVVPRNAGTVTASREPPGGRRCEPGGDDVRPSREPVKGVLPPEAGKHVRQSLQAPQPVPPASGSVFGIPVAPKAAAVAVPISPEPARVTPLQALMPKGLGNPPPPRRCEWIDGDPRDVRRGIDPHCGAPTVSGRSYCSRHLDRAIRPPGQEREAGAA